MIVLLNGASSAGKSSIARELLTLMPTPWSHLAVDDFHAMRARFDYPTQQAFDESMRRTRAGFHRAVAGMAQAGNDVVMDQVLSEPWRLVDCLEVFDGLSVLFIGVHCGEDELARREAERGDRVAGTAAAQAAAVHAHGTYDLEVRTDTSSARDCAARIGQVLDAGVSSFAFDRLRASLT